MRGIVSLGTLVVTAVLPVAADAADIRLTSDGVTDHQVVHAAYALGVDRGAAETLGIGFLWTRQSQEVAGNLTSENDFVDLILGPGKLDVFQEVKPPVRVACIARSLERNSTRPFPGLRETVELLRKAGVPPKRVIIAYNPERQPGTPTQEMDALVTSARRAAEMAQAYGAPLLIGPGLREMQKREDLYAELAKHCDIWMIQSQRLQLDPVTRKPVRPAAYRASVQRIVDRLHEGNPKIRIIVQLVSTAERGASVLSAAEIVAFARSVEDLVDAVRIYGGSKQLLEETIERLRGAASSGLPVTEPSQGDRREPSDALHRARGEK